MNFTKRVIVAVITFSASVLRTVFTQMTADNGDTNHERYVEECNDIQQGIHPYTQKDV